MGPFIFLPNRVRQCTGVIGFRSCISVLLQDQNVDAVYSMMQNSYQNRNLFFRSDYTAGKRRISRFYLLRSGGIR